MNIKKIRKAITLLGLAILISLHCHHQEPPVNPNLMTAEKSFVYPENAQTLFNQSLIEKQLEEVFIRQPLNIKYKPEPWTGRVKYSGVCYHGLFVINKTTITFKLPRLQAKRLAFSIFNPTGSRLLYTVSLKEKEHQTILFKEYYDKEFLDERSVALDQPINKPVELVFQTKGTGVGAWLNPFLINPKKSPRIFIIIVLDTMRADHTSLYGYSRPTTPTLDLLAPSSRVFNHAYSTTSWTLPAHVSLFSGKNLDEHGVTSPHSRISESYPLLAELFQENGFVTAAFTGGGFIEDSFGFYRGFQYYSNLPGSAFSVNSAQRVFNHFKNYIQHFWGNDIFIFLHTYQPHAPYKAPHPYTSQFNKNINTNLKGIKNFLQHNSEYYKEIDANDRQLMIDLYDASILYCDQALVGNIVNYLKNKGVFKNTMLVILSDHGEEFYDHQSWEHGHTLYNELVKIPLLIKYPDNRLTGRENALTSITDIPAILLEESQIHYDRTIFKNEIGKENRILPVLLPVSPIIQQFPPKISFVDDHYHFIFNVIDKKNIPFFIPPPPPSRINEIELFESRDYREKVNIAKRQTHVINRFGKLLETYLKTFQGLKLKQFQLNRELLEKLKSLGYLGN